MMRPETHAPYGHRSRSAFPTLTGIGAVLSRFAFVVATEFQRGAEMRHAEHALNAMPDSMLEDIGISRGAIRRYVRGLPD